MRILCKDRNVALGQFDRTSEDAQMFEPVFSEWRRSLGYHPLMFDSVTCTAAETMFQISTSESQNLMRILHRSTPRARYKWAGDLLVAELSPRCATVSFVVFASWRRQGIGSSAIKLLSTLLADRGYRIFCVGVHPRNLASLRLFRNLGFADLGVARRPRHGWVSRGDHYLELTLSP